MATKNTVLRRSPRSKSAVIIRRLRAYRFHRPQSPKVMFKKIEMFDNFSTAGVCELARNGPRRGRILKIDSPILVREVG